MEAIDWPLNPMQVASGVKHSAILVEVHEETASEAAVPERQLFTFGDGSHGRLGHGPDKELTEDESVALFYTDELVPRQVLALKRHRIVSVSCGGAHTLALHESGTMYSWGVGLNGRLGHGNEAEVHTPKVIEEPKKERKKIVFIAAGGCTSAACDDDGTGMTWGAGGYGRHGQGHTRDVLLPTPIVLAGEEKSERFISMIALGNEHGIALDATGTVHSFGAGADGKLGHGNLQDQPNPKRIDAFDEVLPQIVVSIAAGTRHSVFLTDKGRVHTAGFGANGRLGHGNFGDQRRPKLVAALEGTKVVAVAAGDSHTAVMSQSGDLLCFGWGQYGQLGLGDYKDAETPAASEGVTGRCPL